MIRNDKKSHVSIKKERRIMLKEYKKKMRHPSENQQKIAADINRRQSPIQSENITLK